MISRPIVFGSFVLLLASGPAVGRTDAERIPLVDLVPADTTSVWSWCGSHETEAIERRLLRTADAILDARFDELVLDAVESAGAPEGFVKEARGLRNLVASIAGMLPWRSLLQDEVVYAESGSDMLLAIRPDAAHAAELERSLAGMVASLGGMLIVPVRYDVDENRKTDTTVHQLTLRNERETPLFQIAVHDGTILFGRGREYFESAVGLLEGGGGPRLSDTPRFVAAFDGLPEAVAGRTYVDMKRLAGDLERLGEQIGIREFNSGFWQSLLNDTLSLVDSVESISSTTRCSGDQVVIETLTRFDPASSSSVRAGLAIPASETLLDHVPADAIAFEMRGDVDPIPVFRWIRQRWQDEWEPAADVLWAFDIFEAAVGMSIERDVLSWLGSEQVSVVLPSRASNAPGATDSVTICRVRDPAGTRKVLERIEGVFHAAAPRLIAAIQTFIQERNLPFAFDVRINPEPQSELRMLKITALPMQPPPLVYGMIGDSFVWSTSRSALESCFEVAAGRGDGLADRALVADLLGRAGLCSARMHPAGQGVADAAQSLASFGDWLSSMEGVVEANLPDAVPALDAGIELVEKVTDVLATIDFLGDSVTTSEIRDGGLARYELTRLHVLGAERTPAGDPRAATTVEHGSD